MRLTLAPILIVIERGQRYTVCHTPDPGPTRLANPNRFRGAKPYTETPYFFFFFFFQSLTYTCGYTNNFCNNQKSFTYTRGLPLEWYPLQTLHIC